MGILDWLTRRGKPKLEHHGMEGRREQKEQYSPLVKLPSAYKSIPLELPISILPEEALYVAPESKTFPCGCFMEIQFAELSHLPVMLKREVPRKGGRGSETLRRELQILSQIHHPNILLLMGIVQTDIESTVAIFESAYYGTLYYLLHTKKVTLPFMLIQKFLNELCHVMIFLHERGWLHTSISSHTVLITVSFVLKLTGFESTQTMDMQERHEDLSHEQHLYQCYHWQAPEQLCGRQAPGKKTDVFSVGLLMWEMCTSAEPWLGYTSEELAEKYESISCALGPAGLFPPPSCNLIWLMQQMLQVDPSKRCSSFTEVMTRLNKLQVFSIVQKPVGTIHKAQVISQPLPQKITSTFHKQEQNQQNDRDPFTGLRRVPGSWQKLGGTTSYNASMDTREAFSITRKLWDNDCTATWRFDKENKKNYYPHVTGEHYISDKKGLHLHQKDNKNIANLFSNTQLNIPHTSAQIAGRKHTQNVFQPFSMVNVSYSQDQVSQTVPIKPASHQNQRTITFRKNSLGSKESVKLENIQFFNGRINNLKAINGTSKIQNENQDQFGSQERECVKIKETTMKRKSHDDSVLKFTCYSERQHNSTKNVNIQQNNIYNTNITHLDDGDGQTYNQDIADADRIFISEEKQLCLFDPETHTSRLQCHLKEDESTSTDSGIYTVQKGDDKKIISQANSTEDLYIDDEFGLEMEMESHMQLLCFFDSEFDDYILENNKIKNKEGGEQRHRIKNS